MKTSDLFSLFSYSTSLSPSDKVLLHTSTGRAVEVTAAMLRAYLCKSLVSTFTINSEGYVVINGTTTNYKITQQDISDLTDRIATVESAIASGNLGGDGGADEVHVGESEPTDADAELWVDTSSASQPTYSATIDSNGHLILTVPDVLATIKAKYDGEWIPTSFGSERTVKEIFVSTSIPTDQNASLWVNPNNKRSLVISGYVDDNNHLILNVPDPEPIVYAKIDNSWSPVSSGIGSGSAQSLAVSDYIQIGSARLKYDNATGSVLLIKSDGTTTTL